jgi:Na+/H+ antiporter NhaD/arsenite permease-like protein
VSPAVLGISQADDGSAMKVAISLIFGGALLLLAIELTHRTKIALAGAGLVVLLGALEFEEAIEAIDWATLGLLVGMMIIVRLTERTGVFTYLALRVGQLSRGQPLRLTFLMAGVTGVVSAFLDNLTAILMVVPITISLAELLRVSPVPLVIVEIIGSNIGGTATLIGDPPNIMIGSAVRELGFIDFIVALAPISLIVLLVASGVMYLMFRRQLQVNPKYVEEIFRLDPAKAVRGKPRLKRSLAVLIGTLLLFFVHSPLNLEPAFVALAGATVLLLIASDDVEEAFDGVEWATIFFFIGLFVMVGAVEHVGIIERVAETLQDLTGSSERVQAVAILWTGAVGSALVDNIPFTAAMIPVVEHIQSTAGNFEDGRWWALSAGACFGGNATAIAAAANVAALGLMERTQHPISFMRFLKVGVPITLLSLVFATAYILLVHV